MFSGFLVVSLFGVFLIVIVVGLNGSGVQSSGEGSFIKDLDENGGNNVTCNLGVVEWAEVGQYTCKFNFTDAFSSETKIGNDTIDVKSPPGAIKLSKLTKIDKKDDSERLRLEQESVKLNLKKTGKIECQFRGYPLPDVRWLVKKEDADYHDTQPLVLRSGAKLLNSTNSTVANYSIEFSNVDYSDRMYYICVAENAHGSVHLYTLLRIQGNLAWLWPLIGIIFEVIVFGAIVFIVQRKEKIDAANDRYDADDDED